MPRGNLLETGEEYYLKKTKCALAALDKSINYGYAWVQRWLYVKSLTS